MIDEKLSLINEKSSPLVRIMSVYNYDDLRHRSFANNICAFHIGGGKILSVAHNLRAEPGLVNSISEKEWQSEIATRIDFNHPLFQQYNLDEANERRNLIPASNNKIVSDILKQINYDSRWITQYQKKLCRPFLILHFNEDAFYGNREVAGRFNEYTKFYEAAINRFTFILELELVESYYSDDMALYRIVDQDPSVIGQIPSIEIDYNLYDSSASLLCLQSAPGGFLGRLLNNAAIEGFLDHHQMYHDRIGGHYVMDGLRYLIKGYFRFGSSGAPYLVYDGNSYKAIAVQSEASPIQLSINNNREGNFQYVNAIASPLVNIREKLNSQLT